MGAFGGVGRPLPPQACACRKRLPQVWGKGAWNWGGVAVGRGGAIVITLFLFFWVQTLHANTATTAVSTAVAEMQSGNYLAALNIWQKLLETEPQYITALNNKAYCNLMLGEYAAAAEDYLKADAISQNLDSKAGAQWALLGAEKYGESIQWGRAALAIDPQNYPVKLRMASAYKENGDSSSAENIYADLMHQYGARSLSYAPAGQLIPYYQNIAFSGSRMKSSGYDAGVFGLWNFNSGLSVGAGYAQSNIGNPASTTGYETREAKLSSAVLFSDLSQISFTGHYLSSNYSLLNNAVTLSAAYKNHITSRFTIGGDVLIFSSHKGAALTPQYMFPLTKSLSLGISGTVQAIRFSQVTNFYAAGGAALHYCLGTLCLSAGGLYGSLYTPLFDNGAILTYSLDEMTVQGYGRLAWKPSPYFEISGAYTYGQWKALNGDTPTSGTISFAATGSLF